MQSRVFPYAGGERSAGGKCRSRARGGTRSSQSSPEVRTLSAPPPCREEFRRDECLGALNSLPTDQPQSQTWVSSLSSQNLVSCLICKMGSLRSRGIYSSISRVAITLKTALFGPAHPPRVQKDELHVQAGSKHEHVTVQLDLRDSTRRQRVTHGYKAHILVTAVKGGHVQAVLADLQVATAVNDLCQSGRTRMGDSTTLRKSPRKKRRD